ncbi:MAG: LytTR family DNA-binding domain-containing protein [Bacteroidales bacterium]|nr:LytTR family DNA-binding domain-containing protein [Bacteroidales bacterium]
MKLSCAILDDEQLHIDLLKELIGDIEKIEIKGSFTSPLDLLAFLEKNVVDILFLDVEMEPISGIEMIRQLVDPPSLVFVTSHPEFALEGYEFEPLNYIVKPPTYLDIFKSIERYKRRKGKKNDDYIYIKTGNSSYVKLFYRSILYIQAYGDFIRFITRTKQLNSYFTLKGIKKYLPDTFIQTHRTYIVNTENIDKVSPDEISVGKKSIPLGRTYKSEFEEKVLKGRILKI